MAINQFKLNSTSSANDSRVAVYVHKAPMGAFQKMKYVVEIVADGVSYPMFFTQRIQILQYVAALIRKTEGSCLYKHEFYNNSKGRKCSIARGTTVGWLSDLYKVLNNYPTRDFSQQLEVIKTHSGRPLDQAKSNTNNLLSKTLPVSEQILSLLMLQTYSDSNGDTFYDVDLPVERIHLSPELVELQAA